MQVPSYDQSQVAATPDPTSFQGPSNAGEQAVLAGAAIQQTGSDLQSIAVDQQHLANADTVMRTEAEFKDSYLKMQQSMQNRRGQDAWNVTSDVNDWFEKNQPKYSEGLDNDAQRRAFAATFNSVRQQALETTGRFEADQRRVSMEESGKDSIQASINIAAADHNNQSTVDGARSDITRRVQLMSTLNGWSPEIRDAQMTNSLTDLHKQVIQALVDENPDRARTYYEANKQEIAGSDRDVIDKVIRLGTIRQVAQTATDKIMASGAGETDSLAYARSHFTGQEQDEVVKRVTERFAEADAVRERDQKTSGDRAWNIYSKAGSLNAVPTTLLAGMDGKDRLALQKENDARIAGKLVDTDTTTFYGLQSMASQNPQQFAGTDLRQFYPKLGVEDRKHFIDLQDQVKKTGSSDVQSLNEQLAQTHEVMKWGASDADKKGAFDSAVTRALSQEQATQGRKLTYDERQAVIDRMAIKGNYPGGPWFHAAPYSDVAGTTKAASFTPTIPDDERLQITSALKRRNLPANDAAVMQLYKRQHGLQ
jgi:hypothetical protein